MIEGFVISTQALHLLIDAFAESFESNPEVVHAWRYAKGNHARRLELHAANAFHLGEDRIRRQAANDRSRALLRQRMQAERCFGDHAQRAERSAGDLRQIEAGDVLHDFASTVSDDAVGSNDGDADDQVANRAIPGTARTERAGRHESADRRSLRLRRIERKHLPVLTHCSVDHRERRPRFGCENHVRR